MRKSPTYWTVKHNWDGYLWPRMWPNKSVAWIAIQNETGWTKAYIKKNFDWSIVQVRLVEVATNQRGSDVNHEALGVCKQMIDAVKTADGEKT
jgi:hypothetical protein